MTSVPSSPTPELTAVPYNPKELVRRLITTDTDHLEAYLFLTQTNPTALKELLGRDNLSPGEYALLVLGDEGSGTNSELVPYLEEPPINASGIVSQIEELELQITTLLANLASDDPELSSKENNLIELSNQLELSMTQYKLQNLEWHSTDKQSTGSQLGGLIIHDLGNYALMITSYIGLYAQVADMADRQDSAQLFLQKTVPFIKLTKTFYEVIAKTESDEPFEVRSEILLDTLHLNENIEVIIPQPFTVHSLEEFFAIRTHIFNAIQFEQSKRPIDLDKLTKLPIEKKKINLRVQSQSEDLDSSEKPNPLIVLTRSENNEEGTIEYSITDNITRFWRPKLVVKAWRAYQHGLNCPNLPLVSKKGGMIMSAFLAGQRAAKSGYADKNIYRPSFEIDPVNKSKSVTLRFAR